MMHHCTGVSLPENLVQASYTQKCKFTPEAVYKLVILALT